MMDNKIKKISDVEFIIDLTVFGDSECPMKKSKCAFKDDICEYFCGVKFLDSVLCKYPNKNSNETTELIGGNIGMIPQKNKCPWNEADKTDDHICGLRDTSLCKYYCGIEEHDVLCSYPHTSLSVLKREEIDRDMVLECPE